MRQQATSKTKCLLIILIFTTCIPAYASPTRIAVTEFRGIAVPIDVVQTITDLVRSELFKTGTFEVFERERMDMILKEQGFSQSGLCDQTQCAIKIGKLLAVNTIVVGTISQMGKKVLINVRMVDVTTGMVIAMADRIHTGSIEGLDKTVHLLVRNILSPKNPPSKKEAAIFQKWWFWSLVVAVGGGIGGGLLMQEGNTKKISSPTPQTKPFAYNIRLEF